MSISHDSSHLQLKVSLRGISVNMAPKPTLCDFCREIDFDLLRNPTRSEIEHLNNGGQAPDLYPYKNDRSNRIGSTRYLGLWSRVKIAPADGCSLCRAIVKLMHQQPHIFERLRAAEITDPLLMASLNPAGRLVPPVRGATWNGIDGTPQEYFYLRQLSIEITRQGVGELVKPGIPEWKEDRGRRLIVTEGFQSYQLPGTKHKDQSSKMLFGGRKRPDVIDSKLPAMWLKDCLANHGETCYGESNM